MRLQCRSFVSNDRGETWITLNNALSGNYFVSALTAFDDYLYLGRPGEGAHFSMNNSGFWTDYNAGFPSSSVYLMNDISKLAVLGGKLFAGTASAGIWSICPFLKTATITPTNILTQTPTLTSNIESGNQWYFNGTAINGATSKSITVDESGEYYVVVTTPAGCISPPSAVQQIVIVGEISPNRLGLEFHPNPTNQQLNIDLVNFDPQQPVVIEIFDSLGKVLAKLNRYGGQLIVHETSSYSPSIYIIRCTQGNSVYTSRFIKQP